MKQMRALFVGLGSIGQRHMRNLEQLQGNKVTFSAFRTQGLDRVFDNDLNIVKGQSLRERFALKEYSDFDQALREAPDCVFITNPNSMHIEYAIKAASYGCNLFIEKPISIDMERTDELLDIVSKKGIVAYVGYQYRLHPSIKRLKKCLDDFCLGDVVAVFSEIGERLTGMHKYQDYRNMIESKKELGGGVVKSQIHELDYLCYLFGLPDEVYAIGGKREGFEIDVEDCVTTLCRYKRGNRNKEFVVSVHQDFIQLPPVRKCCIIGTAGRIEVDLLRNTFDLWSEREEIHETYQDFNRNDMFLDEMKLFLKTLENKGKEFVSLKNGMESLCFACHILESLDQKRPIFRER
jgi:predicted dehydrogenase